MASSLSGPCWVFLPLSVCVCLGLPLSASACLHLLLSASAWLRLPLTEKSGPGIPKVRKIEELIFRIQFWIGNSCKFNFFSIFWDTKIESWIKVFLLWFNFISICFKLSKNWKMLSKFKIPLYKTGSGKSKKDVKKIKKNWNWIGKNQQKFKFPYTKLDPENQLKFNFEGFLRACILITKIVIILV